MEYIENDLDEIINKTNNTQSRHVRLTRDDLLSLIKEKWAPAMARFAFNEPFESELFSCKRIQNGNKYDFVFSFLFDSTNAIQEAIRNITAPKVPIRWIGSKSDRSWREKLLSLFINEFLIERGLKYIYYHNGWEELTHYTGKNPSYGSHVAIFELINSVISQVYKKGATIDLYVSSELVCNTDADTVSQILNPVYWDTILAVDKSIKDINVIKDLTEQGWHITIHGTDPISAGRYIKNKRDDIVRKIQQEIKPFPLMDILFSRKKHDEITKLLKELTDISICMDKDIHSDVCVAPPIQSLMYKMIASIKSVSAAKNYTVIDFVEKFGRLATIAQSKPNHCVGRHDFEDCSIDAEMLQDALSTKIVIAERNYLYKYNLKQQRLILQGLYYAFIENNETYLAYSANKARTYPPFISGTMRLLEKEEEAAQNEHSYHTSMKYDTTVVQSVAFLYGLDESARLATLDKLCEYASDFSTKQDTRYRQERALAILAYYLIEGADVKNAVRRRLFFTVYSKSLYKIQADIWHRLCTTPAFVSEIRDSFEKACSIDAISKRASGLPYFNFLWGSVLSDRPSTNTGRRFLVECSKVQTGTWYLASDVSIDVEATISKIEECRKVLSCSDNNDLLYYVYGCSQLLYALSNVSVRNQQLYTEEVYNQLSKAAVLENVLSALVLCDYYNRKLHFSYYRDPNAGYIMSGPLRFLSQYHRLLSKGFIYKLTDSMKKDYGDWIKKEKGRHKYLLIRLLSYTDYPISTTNIENHSDYEDFLPLDDMPSKLTDFISSL